MSSKRFKIRTDVNQNMFFKEDLKVLVTEKDIKVTYYVVIDSKGTYYIPYQIKNGVSYSVSELARMEGKSVIDYMIDESFKPYHSLYDPVTIIPGCKAVVCYKLKVDKVTGDIESLDMRYFSLEEVISSKEMIGVDATSTCTKETYNYLKGCVFNQLRPMIDAHIKVCLNTNV